MHPRCRGSTRGGLSLGPPSTCYTYICDSSTPATRTRETLRRDTSPRRSSCHESACRRDSSLYRSHRDRIVVVVPVAVLSSRSRHTGRITGMRSRRARASRGRGRDTAAPASRTARSTVGRARREGTTYLIADRLRAAPHVCPACIACLSFSSMRVTPRLYGERYLPEVSSRFDESDAAPLRRALLRAR